MSLTSLYRSGPNGTKFELVLVNERDQNDVMTYAQDFVSRLMREPYWNSIADTINISFLGGYYDFKSVRPESTGASAWLPADRFAAAKLISTFVPAWDAVGVLVSDLGGSYGGVQIGQDVAVLTVGQWDWQNLALHEIVGHAIGHCLDEYYGGSAVYDPAVRGPCIYPNVTSDPDWRHAAWANLINTTVLPTRTNAPISGSVQSVPAGTVGMYEGASGFNRGLWRACAQGACKMSLQTSPLCPACVQAVQRRLAAFRGAPEPSPIEPPPPPPEVLVTCLFTGSTGRVDYAKVAPQNDARRVVHFLNRWWITEARGGTAFHEIPTPEEFT